MNLIEKRLLIDDFEPKVSFYRNEEDYKQVFFFFPSMTPYLKLFLCRSLD